MKLATTPLGLILLLAMSTALGCLCGCATKRLPQASGDTPHDAAVSTAVQKALVADTLFDYGDVQVITTKGVTELRGYVSSWEAIDRAYSIARGTPGVGVIQNNLMEKQQ